MPVKAVIFDVGGVLFHQPDRSRQRRWEERLGLEADTLSSTIWQMPISKQAEIGLASRAAVWAEVAQRFSLSPADAAALEADYFSGSEWNVQLIDYARSLRVRCSTGILSNAWSDAREAIKTYVNDTQFDDLICSAEVGLAKPDRRIYELALARLRVQPAQTIFIDDVQSNVEAAQAIGMAGVRFLNTAQTMAEIEQHLAR